MNHKQKSTQLYSHPFSKSYWRDAAAELKDTRILIIAALLIALRVAMKGLAIPLAPNLKINIAFIVNALGAMIFGPVVAAVAAAVSDTLGVLMFPQGPYFFPFVFVEIAGSVIFALFLYRAKVTPTRLALSRFCIDVFVNIALNAPIMALYHNMVLGKSYTWMQLPRIAKNLCMWPIEAIVLIVFMSAMIPIAYRQRLIYFSGEGLKMTKKLALGMLALFVAAAGMTGGYMVYNFNTSNQASWLKQQEKQVLNSALTQQARDQGLVEENQICIIKKVSRKLGDDRVHVVYNVYDTTEQTNLDQVMSYRSTDAKNDESLTPAGGGTAQTVKDDLSAVTALVLDPVE